MSEYQLPQTSAFTQQLPQKTLLDEFAMSALQGMLANPAMVDLTFSEIAFRAYTAATAAMKEKEKQ